MQIERVFPAVVGGTSALNEQFTAEADRQGLSAQAARSLFESLPGELQRASCFYDRLTHVWRYEFGEPFELPSGELLWGTHMWVPVPTLVQLVACACRRLDDVKTAAYFARLGDPSKHRAVLAEMAPMLRVSMGLRAEFEVLGRGVGQRTIDWRIEASGNRDVLFDVKRRDVDLWKQMARVGDARVAPPPDHDASLMFRSVQDKFLPADPARLLQGVWISTEIQQETQEIQRAFEALDPERVHFSVLGGLTRSAHILVRREEDRGFLRELLDLEEIGGFTFERS